MDRGTRPIPSTPGRKLGTAFAAAAGILLVGVLLVGAMLFLMAYWGR
jgi:hypothetical protein